VKIPAVTVRRLSVYAKQLSVLAKVGTEVISSGGLADMCGYNPAQIRKDLAYFGDFGVRGVGYYVQELLFEIRKILGGDKQWRLGLVGAGNLGCALLKHGRSSSGGYHFVAAFDKKEKRVGLEIAGVRIDPLEAMNEAVEKKRVEIGVIAVKATWAQEVADMLIRAGICGILNFSFAQIECPAHVPVENVDFSTKFDKLCYQIKTRAHCY
jgi:redox-sensing transcriptional repressor